MNEALTDLVQDINKLRTDLAEMGEKTENHHEEAVSKLQSMNKTVEELKEKTWELDTSNRNNLVFYGIKEDATLLQKILDRNHLDQGCPGTTGLTRFASSLERNRQDLDLKPAIGFSTRP